MKKALPAVLTALCVLAALLCALTAAGLFDAPRQRVAVACPPLAPAAPATPAAKAEVRVDINTASAEQLMSLPGIGREMAERIMTARDAQPFYFIEDIKNVPGIGDRRFERIRGLIGVGESGEGITAAPR